MKFRMIGRRHFWRQSWRMVHTGLELEAGGGAMESSNEGDPSSSLAASSTLAGAESSAVTTESMMCGAASSIAAIVTEGALQDVKDGVVWVTSTSGLAYATQNITAYVQLILLLHQKGEQQFDLVGNSVNAGGRNHVALASMMMVAGLAGMLVALF